MGMKTTTVTVLECDGCDLAQEVPGKVGEALLPHWNKLKFVTSDERFRDQLPWVERLFCDSCLMRLIKVCHIPNFGQPT
jgi:hypothetical protein